MKSVLRLRAIGTYALAVAAACCPMFARGTPTRTQESADPAFATPLKVPGVKNMLQVAPNLFRGEQPNREGFENLAKMGIQIVVDLRLSAKGAEKKRVTSLGMQYVSIPWWCPTPKDEPFAKFLQLLRDNPDKKIFVHCRTGDDRVAMDIAAYRMVEQGWTADQALNEMEADGANWLHRIICAGTVRYEKNFLQRYQTQPAFEELRKAEATSTKQTP